MNDYTAIPTQQIPIHDPNSRVQQNYDMIAITSILSNVSILSNERGTVPYIRLGIMQRDSANLSFGQVLTRRKHTTDYADALIALIQLI